MSAHAEQTITERLASGTLSLEETLQYGLSLASALKASHERGEPIGKLHPNTISLNGTAVRLLDGAVHDATAYLAPEQIQGNPPDSRSDIFTFGAILQEMLTGSRAFPAQDPDALKQSILSADAAPLNGIRPDLGRLLKRCLAKNPSDRWQRAGALVIELKLALATLRHAQQAEDLKQHLAGIRSDLGSLDNRLLERHSTQVAELTDLRKCFTESGQKNEQNSARAAAAAAALAAVQAQVFGLEQTVKAHATAIESVENAVAQTDEVMEHVVDAFDSLQRTAPLPANRPTETIG